MKRRTFIKSVGIGGAATAFIPGMACATTQQKDELKIIKPPRLEMGDVIGLVAPAGYISENNLNDSRENMEKLGFKIKEGKNLTTQHGYFSSTDQDRADELNEMFADPEIKGIMCARGGYGAARILDKLDYDLIRENPKVLVGYSDITALHYALFKKTGLISFHGPVSISTFNDYSTKNFIDVLMKPKSGLVIESTEPIEDGEDYRHTKITEGTATGRLVGGNLTMAVSLIGTEYDVDSDGAIMYLEEVREEPYRIDRLLTQMIMAGKFEGANGAALGVFRGCEAKANSDDETNSFSLREVLKDRIGSLDIPAIYGLSFGHVKDKCTIPFGIQAELDVDAETLTLLEPAVL